MRLQPTIKKNSGQSGDFAELVHHEWCDGESHENHGRTDEWIGCEQPDQVYVYAGDVVAHGFLQEVAADLFCGEPAETPLQEYHSGDPDEMVVHKPVHNSLDVYLRHRYTYIKTSNPKNMNEEQEPRVVLIHSERLDSTGGTLQIVNFAMHFLVLLKNPRTGLCWKIHEAKTMEEAESVFHRFVSFTKE